MSPRPEHRPRWDIGDVLARTDLAALLDEFAEPATNQVRGRRWHCPIPDHTDDNASVTMHIDHRGHERWRCWSGDNTHRGDAIDLVVATQRTTRGEAIDWLANRAGMIPDRPLPPVTRKPPPPRPTLVPLDPVVARYAQACERILSASAGAPVRDWLHARGFNDDTIRANRLGADPGRHMMRRARGLPYGSSVAATFPALDPGGEIRYVQARYLDPGDGPKYDNPAGALGTNPRLAWARTTGDVQPGVLVVCEGIPDALTAAQAGYRAVGILGSQAPDQRVATQLVTHAEQHYERLVAIVDADPAGRAWGGHLTGLIDGHGHELDVVEPPDGLDLNEWVSRDPHWSAAILPTLDHAPVPARATPTMARGIELASG